MSVPRSDVVSGKKVLFLISLIREFLLLKPGWISASKSGWVVDCGRVSWFAGLFNESEFRLKRLQAHRFALQRSPHRFPGLALFLNLVGPANSPDLYVSVAEATYRGSIFVCLTLITLEFCTSLERGRLHIAGSGVLDPKSVEWLTGEFTFQLIGWRRRREREGGRENQREKQRKRAAGARAHPIPTTGPLSTRGNNWNRVSCYTRFCLPTISSAKNPTHFAHSRIFCCCAKKSD